MNLSELQTAKAKKYTYLEQVRKDYILAKETDDMRLLAVMKPLLEKAVEDVARYAVAIKANYN